MDLPSDVFIDLTLKVGCVYNLKAPELIETEERHYFLVVAIDGDDNFLVLSTTNKKGKEKHIKNRNYHPDTLTHIRPTEENGLTENSYFNCNDYYTISKDELIAKHNKNDLSFEGTFNDVEYEAIVSSIKLSHVNDIPRSYLKK